MSHHDEEHVEIYGDDKIVSKDASVPKWLILTYLILPLWGFGALYYYFDGSTGWLDRGYWQQLQRAALTTFPMYKMSEEKSVREELKPDSVTEESSS